MLLSLKIKYLQANKELMLEGRTAINRSDLSSGVMSPTRPGSLHPEQLIYYLGTFHVMMIMMMTIMMLMMRMYKK